jgi:hypothetical protein
MELALSDPGEVRIRVAASGINPGNVGNDQKHLGDPSHIDVAASGVPLSLGASKTYLK